MDKALFIEQLYHDLIDDIAFDEDIKALSLILISLLKIDQNKSINNWVTIMKRYDLKKKSKDINFSPLTHYFLIEVLKVNSITKLFSILKLLPYENVQIIKDDFFNVFNIHSGINQYLNNLILKKKTNNQILSEIQLILKQSSSFNKLVFDEEVFLKNVIEIFLKNQIIDIKFLLKVADLTNNSKNRALLKTLLIDYI